MESLSSPCRTSIRDIIRYYDAITITKAKTVCDYGPALYCNGLISRQFLDTELPAGLLLDGILTDPSVSMLPLYETVYDSLYTSSSYRKDTVYDLGLFLAAPLYSDSSIMEELIQSAGIQCRYLFTSQEILIKYPGLQQISHRLEVPLDNVMYYLLLPNRG